MIRITLVIVGIFLIGIIAGFQINSANTPQNAPIIAVDGSHDLQDKLYQENLEAKELEITRLSDKNIKLTQEIEAFRLSLAGKNDSTIPENLPMPLEDSAPEEIAEELSDDDEVKSDEERDKERDARRQEFVTRMRTSMLDRWGKEWDKASPESQERITEISEYEQELVDLRMSMRDATDEEREEIREEESAVRKELGATLKTEQNARLESIATKYGITSTKDINQFLADTQEQLQSPIFQTNANRGRGGPRGGDRGRRR